MMEVAYSLLQERRCIVIRRQCVILRIAFAKKKIKCQAPMSQNDDRCRKFIIHLSRAYSKFKRHSKDPSVPFTKLKCQKGINKYPEEDKNSRKSCNARSMTRRDRVRFNRTSFSTLCNFDMLVDWETWRLLALPFQQLVADSDGSVRIVYWQ